MMLIAFSLYASFALFDTSTTGKGQAAMLYEMKVEQIEALKKQRDILLAHDKATLSAPVSAKIEAMQLELSTMSAPKTVGANVDLIANIVLSILLELSIFSCHVAMRRTRKNSSYSNGQKRTQKS
ncbi:MAG: hypothetical protein ACRC7P_08740, partial [Enterovibrio sp.]